MSLTMRATAAHWETSTQSAPSVWGNDAGTSGFLWASSGVVTGRNKLYGEGRGNTIATRYQHGGGNEPFFIAGQTLEIGGGGRDARRAGRGKLNGHCH